MLPYQNAGPKINGLINKRQSAEPSHRTRSLGVAHERCMPPMAGTQFLARMLQRSSLMLWFCRGGVRRTHRKWDCLRHGDRGDIGG